VLSSAEPAAGLGAVRALQRMQERLEAIHVANARAHGWSWQAIADALEVSRQAVYQKYNRIRDRRASAGRSDEESFEADADAAAATSRLPSLPRRY
jgi:Homeodomain-like domain